MDDRGDALPRHQDRGGDGGRRDDGGPDEQPRPCVGDLPDRHRQEAEEDGADERTDLAEEDVSRQRIDAGRDRPPARLRRRHLVSDRRLEHRDGSAGSTGRHHCLSADSPGEHDSSHGGFSAARGGGWSDPPPGGPGPYRR